MNEQKPTNTNMFCFQCEQTAGGKGCTGKAGVCGKLDSTANLQDELITALIGLAECTHKHRTPETDRILLEGLFTTITNVNFNNETITRLTQKIINLTKERTQYPMRNIWEADEDTRSLKSFILFGLKGIAAYAYHAQNLGYSNKEVTEFFYTALSSLSKPLTNEEFLHLTMETGRINLICMELLDTANTESYGEPHPTTVPLTIEKGPFIVVSGHDLHDLELLLKQTEGKGVNVYTHSEMLPAHGYPKLKAYEHLKGNFGTAWQNQQKEFHEIPAPVLFTTNCLMPVKPSYADRIYTTEIVSYPELIHIDEKKDFTAVINKALELGGYSEDKHLTGINGGSTVTTGFAHGTVLGIANTVIDAVKAGRIKHFYLVGGCDGARPGRNYYTDFVKKTSKDTIILTLACGKYRFNDLELGEIDGIPRLLDVGQCNDAFSAIKIATALAEAFDCSINELPLSMVLSWYEQKAVAILLTLLYLGVKNILIGPSLPAFASPAVLNLLTKNYNLTPITTPEQDLAKIHG